MGIFGGWMDVYVSVVWVFGGGMLLLDQALITFSILKVGVCV